MTKLSLALEDKNSSYADAAPQKGGVIVEIDPDCSLPDPEFEINATTGLCIEDPVILEANIEPLQLSNPILNSETCDSIINKSEVVVEGVVSVKHNKETVIVDDKYSASSFPSSIDNEQKIDHSNTVRVKFHPLWGLVSICGRRRNMEDSAVAMPRFAKIPCHMLFDDDNSPHYANLPNQDLTAHLFGVYDGHGGCQVANFCREHLHQVLANEIKENHTHQRVDPNVQYSREDRWREIFTNCFRKLDDEVGGFSQVNGVSVNKPLFSDSVGSTAVVAVVCSTHVILGNCGDSRAVLCRGKEPIPLSVDHKPEREDECARIEALGGRIISWHGYRVSGVLTMSRSIGDRCLRPYVISDPDVTVVPRANEDECLILASDGLWDVITNKEACDIARRRLMLWHKKNGGNKTSEDGEQSGDKVDEAAQDASEYLSKLALQRGSGDNISVIVVDLKAKRKLKKTGGNKT